MAGLNTDTAPPVTQRLEDALFELLHVMPFEKISISAVVRQAGVNRNTFYYHYAELDELAEKALRRNLDNDIPRLIAQGLFPDAPEFDDVYNRAIGDGYYKKMRLAMGPGSSVRLRRMIKESMVDFWLEAFGVSSEDLDDQAHATVRFAVGGAFEALDHLVGTLDPSDVTPELVAARLKSFRSSSLIQTCAKILAQTLQESAERSNTER